MKSVLFGLSPVVLLLAGCATQEAYDDTKRELASQDEVIRTLKTRNDSLLSKQRSLSVDLKASRAEVAALKAGKAGVDKDVAAMKTRLAEFEKSFGKWDAEAGIRVKAHAEGVALEVAETLLFKVGKARLSAKGESVLGKLAEKLAAHPGNIRIDGHTDDQAVVVHAKEYPYGNLQLSGRRALVVAHFLVGKGGLPAGKVSFAGYGEHKPLVSNAGADGRARNRRVEIVLLSTKAR